MSVYSSKDVFLLVGGYDLTNVSDKLEDNISSPLTDTTPFGTSSAECCKSVLKKYELTGHDGWYDDASTSINAAMVDLASSERVLMLLPNGNTLTAGATKRAICAGGLLTTSYKRSFSVGEFHRASFECAISGVQHEAYMACSYAQQSGETGDTKALYGDMTASCADGGTAYMCCTQLNLASYTNLKLELQSSSDHITFTTPTGCTFTNLTAVGAEKLTVPGSQTINRYLCAKWTFQTGTGSPTATFVVAFIPN
jgi:hypothetical protein